MINRLLYGTALGVTLVTLSTAAYADDVLDDIVEDIGTLLGALF